MRPLGVALLVCALLPAAGADEPRRVLKSGPKRVALLELYTSEGCSSCPSADTWMSTLPGRGLSLDKVVPLALHVDYWNDIGWVDPFSKPRFTTRQREAASRSGSGLYTPESVLNGRELRDRAGIAEQIEALNATRARAEVTLEIGAVAGDKVRAIVRTSSDARTRLYLALYENELAVAVKSGENGGRTLKHDFVVRELVGPLDARELDRELSIKSDWKRGKLGLAAFVEDAGSGEVLQVVAAPL